MNEQQQQQQAVPSPMPQHQPLQEFVTVPWVATADSLALNPWINNPQAFAQWMATNNLISGEQTAEVQLQQQQLLMHAQHCLQQLLATQPPLPQAAPSSQQPPPQPVPPQQPQQQQAQQQQPPPQPPQLLPMPMPMPQPVPQSQYDAAAMQLPSGLPPPPLPQEVAAQQMQLPPPMQGTAPPPPTGTAPVAAPPKLNFGKIIDFIGSLFEPQLAQQLPALPQWQEKFTALSPLEKSAVQMLFHNLTLNISSCMFREQHTRLLRDAAPQGYVVKDGLPVMLVGVPLPAVASRLPPVAH
eukprot:TRINITY_DN5576_c0_g1_i1.p1 TRINITY_DN5576_c0_g1~~TRINITY_DN5576_c0_g1_i1.p1  ORF type:complete len:297 (+),score=133.69 TRINITY_DN5576_c0_g1_i1:13-903(+)